MRASWSHPVEVLRFTREHIGVEGTAVEHGRQRPLQWFHLGNNGPRELVKKVKVEAGRKKNRQQGKTWHLGHERTEGFCN